MVETRRTTFHAPLRALLSAVVRSAVLAPLLATGACTGPSVEGEGAAIDQPVLVDVSQIGFERARQPVRVRVRVVDPEQVYLHETHAQAGISDARSRARVLLGKGLVAATPLVWGRYLELATDDDAGAPTIEHEVSQARGSTQLQVGMLGDEMGVRWQMQLVLTCRLRDASGAIVDEFSSRQEQSLERKMSRDEAMQALSGATERSLVAAFDEILPLFFASELVAAELERAGTRPGAGTGSIAGAPPFSAERVAYAAAYAVVIGVSEYLHAGEHGLDDLAFADDDAHAFRRTLLELGWDSDHIRCLTNEEATKAGVEAALQGWLTKAGRDDLIVLYWSGHGFPDPADTRRVYFACHDTDASKPYTGWRMDQVLDAISEREARNVVVIADTCHAGKLVTRGSDRDLSIRPFVERLRTEKRVPAGWIYMVASDTDRKAIEDSSLAGGAFTHCLVEGLRGKADSDGDQRVSMLELKAWMASTMPEVTRRILSVAKHPVILTNSADRDIWNLDLSSRRP